MSRASRDVAAIGEAYARQIRAFITPEKRIAIAKDRYVRGEIDLAELERLIKEALS